MRYSMVILFSLLVGGLASATEIMVPKVHLNCVQTNDNGVAGELHVFTDEETKELTYKSKSFLDVMTTKANKGSIHNRINGPYLNIQARIRHDNGITDTFRLSATLESILDAKDKPSKRIVLAGDREVRAFDRQLDPISFSCSVTKN
ncbi:MAG: hypothetical protein AB7H97_01075 [Pseudobdellovibrionaceae bacterium]